MARVGAIDTFKLHAKDVSRIDNSSLLALPSADPAIRATCEQELRWLHDDSLYVTVPQGSASQCPKARMSDEFVDQLAQLGIVRPIRPADVRGHVRLFLVPEIHKQRLRPIKFTKDANDALGRETLSKMMFPSKKQIAELVHKGDVFLALDFAAYYDQFTYAPEVGSRFCFKADGKHYALQSLAMGQRQAVQVAMAATSQILNFQKRSSVEIVIDNVIFVGSREEVLADATEFCARCALVGAQLNEDVNKLEEYVVTTGDWCGLHLDMTAKTVQLSQKTLDNTAESWRRLSCWTWRGFAAHVGLLFWSWGIVDAPVSEFFGLLSFVSKVSRLLAEQPELWDEPATIYPSALQPMQRWTAIALANAPRRVPVRQEVEWLVCTDASRWGWGYCALNAATGEVRTHGAPWSAAMEFRYGDQLSHSTCAEPHGITHSLVHLIAPLEVRAVRVGTDNTAARWGFAREFSSHSKAINDAITQMRQKMPMVQIEFMHIPGATNAADRVSRGGHYAAGELAQVAESLRRSVGNV